MYYVFLLFLLVEMTLSLYEYSQLSIVVETMALAVCLMHIGKAKIKHSGWIKFTKWSIVAVLMLVGIITFLQFAFNMNEYHYKLDLALNITMLYLVTILLGGSFVQLTAVKHLTPMRQVMTLAVFLMCVVLVWIAAIFDTSLTTLLIVGSLAVYFFELVRILTVLFVSYRDLVRREHVAGSNLEATFTYAHLLVRCSVLLSLFALLYIVMVMLSPQVKAIYNFSMLLVWAYLFVSFVNLMINYNPIVDLKTNETTDSQINKMESLSVAELRIRIEEWVQNQSYCEHGTTMLQLSQQLGTNRTYLSRYINSHYGCSFNEWLNRLRIDEAKRRLVSSPALSIEAVAQQVGYANKSHFMHSFKSLEGMTPGQWRQQHIAG